jgi:hypothetical protein
MVYRICNEDRYPENDLMVGWVVGKFKKIKLI